MNSVPALLARNAREFKNAPAYREKEYGIWQSWTWEDAAEEIEALALGLLNLGVNEGDYIAVIGRNRPYLYWSMVAAQMVGAIPVPLYQDANAEEMAYVLGHCGARFVIAGDQEQVDKVIEVQEDLHQFEHMIYLDPRGMRKYDHSRLHEYEHVQVQGRAAFDEFEKELKRRVEAATWDTTCVMLYTSGTTGKP
ncbi:MAG: AMP-binding protein, partial [Halocynthiibacter sp.]